MNRLLPAVALALTAASGCRLNPECFGQNECELGFVCQEGRCREASTLRDGGTVTTPYTWYRDVEPVVVTFCQNCHGMPLTSGAPLPLITYADVTTASPSGAPVFERMAARVADARFPMPPSGSPALTAAQIEIIQSWANGGAPEGVAPVRDGGPRDAGPERDGGPPRDGGPINPIPQMGVSEFRGGGLQQGEGPLWRDTQNDLLLVDVPTNRVLRFDPAGPGGFVDFRPNANQPGALRFDPQGNLLTTEMGARRISITRGGGQPEDFATLFQGMRFNGPNDLDVRADGTIYFTDPAIYALLDPMTESETGVTAVYRRAPDGTVFQESTYDLLATPNGVALSPTELQLFVAFTNEGEVHRFDVEADGSLSNEMVLSNQVPNADGMDHDVTGNLYVAFQNGIMIFAPDGTMWGTYENVQGQIPSNVAFGGAQRDTLYVTTDVGLVSIPVGVPGAR